MGAMDLDSLRNLAALARLRLDDEELRRLAPEFERILQAFGALASAGRAAEPAEPREPPRARPDEPKPSLERDAILAAAPAASEGFFAVPKTIGSAR